MCGRNIGAIFSGPRPCLCPPSPAGSTLRPTAAPYGSPPTAICPPRVMPGCASPACGAARSEEHTSELQSRSDLVCRLLLEKKKKKLDKQDTLQKLIKTNKTQHGHTVAP